MTGSASTSHCKPDAGKLVPVIDRNRCEAKAECVAVCPYQVFEIRALDPEQRGQLSTLGRIKAFVHGGKQAFVARPDACHGCGACVTACPEDAITLRAASERASLG